MVPCGMLYFVLCFAASFILRLLDANDKARYIVPPIFRVIGLQPLVECFGNVMKMLNFSHTEDDTAALFNTHREKRE